MVGNHRVSITCKAIDLDSACVLKEMETCVFGIKNVRKN
jgi:hypothetical protein